MRAIRGKKRLRSEEKWIDLTLRHFLLVAEKSGVVDYTLKT